MTRPTLAADADAAATVWAAVAALPDGRQAAAVEFHYRRGWPIERVADVMGCPVGTVKTLLFRARQRLRAVLVETRGVPVTDAELDESLRRGDAIAAHADGRRSIWQRSL